MPIKVQVVVYRDEYDTSIYTNKDQLPDMVEVEVIEIDVTQYYDLIPKMDEMRKIKADIDKITIPAAKESIMYWYNENLQYAEDFEQEEIAARLRIAERNKILEDENVKNAIQLLTDMDIEVKL